MLKWSWIVAALIAVPHAQACAPKAADGAVRIAAEGPADASSAEFEALGKEYAAADGAYRKRVQEATKSGADAKALPHPAIEFFPRYEALAAKGEGRALLWMANRMSSAHPDRTKDENREASWALFSRVANDFVDATWIRDFTRGLTTMYFDFGRDRVDGLVDAFVAKSTIKEAVAEALYRAREEAKRAKLDERAKALEGRLIAEFADTEYGRRARGIDPTPPAAAGGKVVIQVGKEAPDFTTKDAEGVEFKLSDYKGKVVVLDFWGFW